MIEAVFCPGSSRPSAAMTDAVQLQAGLITLLTTFSFFTSTLWPPEKINLQSARTQKWTRSKKATIHHSFLFSPNQVNRAGGDDSETIAALPNWNWLFVIFLKLTICQFWCNLGVHPPQLPHEKTCMPHGYTCALICAGPSRGYAQRVLQTPNKSVQSGKTGSWKHAILMKIHLHDPTLSFSGRSGWFCRWYTLGGNGVVSA